MVLARQNQQEATKTNNVIHAIIPEWETKHPDRKPGFRVDTHHAMRCSKCGTHYPLLEAFTFRNVMHGNEYRFCKACGDFWHRVAALKRRLNAERAAARSNSGKPE